MSLFVCIHPIAVLGNLGAHVALSFIPLFMPVRIFHSGVILAERLSGASNHAELLII